MKVAKLYVRVNEVATSCEGCQILVRRQTGRKLDGPVVCPQCEYWDEALTGLEIMIQASKRYGTSR